MLFESTNANCVVFAPNCDCGVGSTRGEYHDSNPIGPKLHVSSPPATHFSWHVRGRSLSHSRCARSLRGRSLWHSRCARSLWGRSFLRLLRPTSRGMCVAALWGIRDAHDDRGAGLVRALGNGKNPAGELAARCSESLRGLTVMRRETPPHSPFCARGASAWHARGACSCVAHARARANWFIVALLPFARFAVRDAPLPRSQLGRHGGTHHACGLEARAFLAKAWCPYRSRAEPGRHGATEWFAEAEGFRLYRRNVLPRYDLLLCLASRFLSRTRGWEVDPYACLRSLSSTWPGALRSVPDLSRNHKVHLPFHGIFPRDTHNA